MRHLHLHFDWGWRKTISPLGIAAVRRLARDETHFGNCVRLQGSLLIAVVLHP